MQSPPQTHNQLANNSQRQLDRFLVCGLGSLGQHCVAVLKEYGAIVSAIDQAQPHNWEIPELLNLLEQFFIGDCRQAKLLEQAQIHHCRTVILVTEDERVNTEAAFAARLLNPQARIVLRSAKHNLNQLLSQNLGNFVAFEPNQLTASAFAFAALGAGNIAYFNLEGYLLRVSKRQIQPDDGWANQWQIHQLNTSYRRVLSHMTNFSNWPKHFYQWNPERTLQPGDTIVYIEDTGKLIPTQKPVGQQKLNWRQIWQQMISRKPWQRLKQNLTQLWKSNHQYQTLRVAIICGLAVLLLWFWGTILYGIFSSSGIAGAFYTTAVLLLGGYGDIFGGVDVGTSIPEWLRLFSLGLTLAGTAFVGVLYALLTEKLLSSRFELFTGRRLPVPQQEHIVLIGLNPVGQKVASLLQDLKQPLVSMSQTAIDKSVLPHVPLIVGKVNETMTQANITHANSVVVMTEDDLENLEIGLMAHTQNPTINLIIRTYDQHFRDHVAQLFPYAQVLCTSALSAEVFAAAAFGENILSLFHFHNQTILVVEYIVEEGDTLNGLMIAEVAYGYDVVPILYQKSQKSPPKLMPSGETLLSVGNRMVVLATTHSLQIIERGETAPRTWQVEVEKALVEDAVFDGANEISMISGCPIGAARKLMNNLPGQVPVSLYEHQAQRLVRRLNRVRVISHLVRADTSS